MHLTPTLSLAQNRQTAANATVTPRFGGNLSTLFHSAHSCSDQGEAYYNDSYLKRPDRNGGFLEDNIVSRALADGDPQHILITGSEGVGKTTIIRKIKQDLIKQGVPIFVTNGNSGWKPYDKTEPDLSKFLEEHVGDKRVVLFAEEIGMSMMLSEPIVEEQLKKITENPRYSNVVIIGESLTSMIQGLDPNYETLLQTIFPPEKEGTRVDLKAMTTDENLDVIKNALDASHFTGFTDAVRTRFRDAIDGTNVFARKVLQLIDISLTDWLKSNNPDRVNSDLSEEIPTEVFDKALDKVKEITGKA